MADLNLGELVDSAAHQRTGAPVAVPTSDLTTHGVIVGMTGSGKTGLGIVLIEEALSAGVPCLLIDPKGDLTNLRLIFPDLAPADFRPWINDGDAQKAGVTPEEFAAQQSTTWRDGLAGWGIGPDRLQTLTAGTRTTIYTPGSTAGVPLNLVGSLQAPTVAGDIETMRDEIEGYVAGLLGLVGIAADPLSSREHILLANLIETSWTAGRSLDLPTLVAQVQQPPIRKLGVFELDQFFPPADRTALAMRLNGLLASPAFAAWAAGPPLDLDAMLRTPEGLPCAAVVTIAHLSDEERQFVVALLLSKLVTWMRKQSGTTDLRAMLYMDEVAGYVPPSANPPTKKPIMLLMKQARAFGVGVILATQNPVDLDYKAISNAGTWMVGRLQTERDKARLLDGMSAAAGGVDTQAVGDTISGLAKREFVLRRAGKDTPEVFTTRWAMSYLRGPLTRDQIARLTTGGVAPAAPPLPPPPPTAAPAAGPATTPTTPTIPTIPPAPAAPTASPTPLADDETPIAPEVAAGTAVRWLDAASSWALQVGAVPNATRWEAAAVARVRLRYDDTKADLVADEEWEAVLFPLTAPADAAAAVAVDYDDRDLLTTPPEGIRYALPHAPVKDKRFWAQLQRDLIDHLVRSRTMAVQTNRVLKLYSRAGETPASFAARCTEAADARADDAQAALRSKYETKARRLQSQLATAHGRAEVLATEARSRQQEEVVSAAGGLLGAFLGGRRSARSMASVLGGATSRRGRTSTSNARLDAAHDKLAALEDDLEDLAAEVAADLEEIDQDWAAKAAEIDTITVPLEKSDVQVVALNLVWVPVDGPPG